jgi:hypothetical protein
VTHGRHRRAGSTRRAQRLVLLATPVALVASVVILRVFDGGSDPLASEPPASEPTASAVDLDRGAEPDVSRSLVGSRPALLKGLVDQGLAVEEEPTVTAVAATVKRFLTTDLNVWTGPGESFHLATVLETGSTVQTTGLVKGEWAQIIYHHEERWVRASYLSKDKPTTSVVAAAGVTQQPCRLGTGVEAGLTPDAIRVYRSVCAAFPAVASYGGVRPDGGEHGEGRALDIMVSSSALGDAIAAWVRAHAAQLGASEVLWAQHIWTVERSSEGWRLFPDRGSATANHFDHVHVTVYGDSGG